MNRGVVQFTFRRVGDTEEFLETRVGHVFMANAPGQGVVLRDVGRVVVTADEEEDVLFSAGKRLPESDFAPALCAALA